MKTLKYILAALLFMLAMVANAQMVLEYDIVIANTEIALPLAGTVNVSVDWGDGSAAETFNSSGRKPHTFTTTGTKTVTITGTLTAYGISNFTGSARLTKVLSWDGLGLTNFTCAFYAATSLIQVPASLPATVTNLSYMFCKASAFNHPIESWNTTAVTDMTGMFSEASAFNQPIAAWNTAAVTYMVRMFAGASAFNQPLEAWNTAAVTNMSFMFASAHAFNQPIGLWNTAAVTNMSYMFYQASNFNQPIASWNTAAVTNMSYMFFYVSNFNQSIGSWNTAAVSDMSYMFSFASAFNQPIGSWNIVAVTNMSGMFFNAGLCTDNYDNLLNGWASQAVKTGVSFGAGYSKYSSAGTAARATLIGKGWTISDSGIGTATDAKCTTTDIEEESNASTILLYPNPVSDKLTVRFAISTKELLDCSIYTHTGLLVLEKDVQSNGLSIEMALEPLPKGVYLIKIKSKESVYVHSFIKE